MSIPSIAYAVADQSFERGKSLGILNLSGGLLGTMHAVGATGIFQCGEVFWQLQKKYDQFHGDQKLWDRYGKKKPDDWRSLQVADPKRGVAISHAGVGSHVTCAVLEKAW